MPAMLRHMYDVACLTPVLRDEPVLFNRVKLGPLERPKIAQECDISGTIWSGSATPEIGDFRYSGAERNDGCASPALDRATGKILGKFAVPFTGLGGDSAMGGRPLFCSATQIKTLVRLH